MTVIAFGAQYSPRTAPITTVRRGIGNKMVMVYQPSLRPYLRYDSG
jgi:hypothetical protein